MSGMKVLKVCAHCGSDKVLKDAWARWDFESQEWVLDDVFDNSYCFDCENETRIEEIKES